jgi:hypothetical protein
MTLLDQNKQITEMNKEKADFISQNVGNKASFFM